MVAVVLRGVVVRAGSGHTMMAWVCYALLYEPDPPYGGYWCGFKWNGVACPSVCEERGGLQTSVREGIIRLREKGLKHSHHRIGDEIVVRRASAVAFDGGGVALLHVRVLAVRLPEVLKHVLQRSFCVIFIVLTLSPLRLLPECRA